VETRLQAFDGRRSLRLERPDEAARVERHVDVGDPPRPTGMAIVDLDGAVGDRHPGEADVARVERRLACRQAQVAKPPVGVEGETHHRRTDLQRRHVDLAPQQRRELDLGVDARGGGGRIGVRAEPHVVEHDRGRRQQAQVRVAEHAHARAQQPRRLPLDLRPVGRPVDEVRADQRRCQRHDHRDRDRHEERVQPVSPSLPVRSGPVITRPRRACPD
jgi:hypothetical protein